MSLSPQEGGGGGCFSLPGGRNVKRWHRGLARCHLQLGMRKRELILIWRPQEAGHFALTAGPCGGVSLLCWEMPVPLEAAGGRDVEMSPGTRQGPHMHACTGDLQASGLQRGTSKAARNHRNIHRRIDFKHLWGPENAKPVHYSISQEKTSLSPLPLLQLLALPCTYGCQTEQIKMQDAQFNSNQKEIVNAFLFWDFCLSTLLIASVDVLNPWQHLLPIAQQTLTFNALQFCLNPYKYELLWKSKSVNLFFLKLIFPSVFHEHLSIVVVISKLVSNGWWVFHCMARA